MTGPNDPHGQLSPDGKWWWDGQKWQPVEQAPQAIAQAPPPSKGSAGNSRKALFIGIGVGAGVLLLFSVCVAALSSPSSPKGAPVAVATSTPTATATLKTPTAAPTAVPTPPPTAAPTVAPAAPQQQPPPPPPPPAPKNLCGAPSNPWGYNFCGGATITSPPGDFCQYFNCIGNFWNGRGYVIECNDGAYSKSGGIRGSCSYHQGDLRPLYQ